MSNMNIQLRRLCAAIASASFFFFAPLVYAASRPIPEIVNVKIFATTFATAEGAELELLVRVPLAAVKDVQFPTRADGDTLDLVALKSMLPGAAKYWIATMIAVSDHGTALAAPQVAATQIAISANRSFDSYEAARNHLGSPFIS